MRAKHKLQVLLDRVEVTPCGKREAIQAAQQIEADDFEDAIQYFSALNAGCSCIISNTVDDFYYTDIPVYKPESYLNILAESK